MPTTCSRSSVKLLLPLLFVACTSPEPVRWPTIDGVDGGGFTVTLPNEHDVQRGVMEIGGEEVRSHVAMTADTGVTYIAAWYDLPEAFRELPTEERITAAWNVVVERSGEGAQVARGPLGDDTDEMRNAWILNAEGTRMAVVLVLRDMRVVILTTATPDFHFDARAERNILRFLRSLKFQ